jgi:transcription elongation GreA/GreB family factor
VNKSTVRDLVIAQLRSALELQTRAALLARDEAISEESRPENQYDMHSQEAAYLAEGQARHAAEISETLALYESLALTAPAAQTTAAVGALVEVAGTKGRPTWYFLGPRGGGLEVELDGQTILVVTPQSPLGRELLGKSAGAPVRLPGRAAGQPHRIASVR